MSKKTSLKSQQIAHGQGRTQRTSVLGVRPAMQRRLLSHIPRAPLSTASSSWRSQLSTLVKYTRKLHAKVAKSRKKVPKWLQQQQIETRGNKNFGKIVAQSPFFWQQLQQQQPQSQSQVRFQFRFQWLNLLLSLETGNWLQDKQQQLGEAEAAQTEADGNMWQAWRGNNII